MMFELLLDVMDRTCEIPTLRESHRTLRDGSFGVALSQALRAMARSVLSLRHALSDISQQHLVRCCCEMSRRDVAIVARHEVPGKAPLERAVP